MKIGLFIGLGLFAAGFIFVWWRALAATRRAHIARGNSERLDECPGCGYDLGGLPARSRCPECGRSSAESVGSAIAPTKVQLLLGFVTNFFDTLGIGSFAPTASFYKITKMVPDALIPGTMNVGHTIPVVIMAYIFIMAVAVEPTTLLVLIVAAVLGAWLGADVVSRLPRKPIQIGIGVALLAAAIFLTMKQLDVFPIGGEALGLGTGLLIAAAVTIAVLGALNTIGVGLFAPCMIMIALLGMDPKAAFPIMMGSCAFLMPVASSRFVQRERYHPRAALGLTLGGIPAVFLAAYIVKSLPLSAVFWLVIVVATYTSLMMLWSAYSGGGGEEPGDVAGGDAARADTSAGG